MTFLERVEACAFSPEDVRVIAADADKLQTQKDAIEAVALEAFRFIFQQSPAAAEAFLKATKS